jgi:putative transcriptional regulator
VVRKITQTPKVLRLRKLRRGREWTQEHIAKLLDIDVTSYNRIEKGRQQPLLDLSMRIAGLFDKPVEEVFAWVDVDDEVVAQQEAATQ